jgi:hypothetical protein
MRDVRRWAALQPSWTIHVTQHSSTALSLRSILVHAGQQVLLKAAPGESRVAGSVQH